MTGLMMLGVFAMLAGIALTLVKAGISHQLLPGRARQRVLSQQPKHRGKRTARWL